MEYLEGLKAIVPELVLTATALAALVLDLLRKGRDSRFVGYLTLVGLGLTAIALAGQWNTEPKTVLGMVTVDRFGNFFKAFTVAALAVVTVFVLSDRRERKHHIGEYYFLLLGAGIGIFFLVGTTNLLLLMLGLELLSLASYALAGFHKGDRRSAEAAMKYVVFGGLSAGVMLYGISLLYGLTGTIDIARMGDGSGGALAALSEQLARSPVPVGVALTLILAGFAYKVSVVPFHFWTPDVYEGAPTPVTTFLAVASKAGGFGALLRFVGVLFLGGLDSAVLADYAQRFALMLAVLSAVTMTVGNLAAVRQESLKRLLAYSSIAHAGYVLMGVACMTAGGFSAAMYYLAAYYFMNLGAFGFLLYFEGVTGSDAIDSLRGLGWKAPVVSIAMIVFLVSLTGLPPTVGFYGKWLLIREGLAAGLGWLVVVMVLNSAVSLFYYFRVAKALFLAEASERAVLPQPLFVGLLALLAVGTVWFAVGAVEPLADLATRSALLLR